LKCPAGPPRAAGNATGPGFLDFVLHRVTFVARGAGCTGRSPNYAFLPFLCVRGAKLFFGHPKPIFDNACGIIWFEAIFRGVGGGWWHAAAGRRECAVERKMPMADAVESRWGEVPELGLARVDLGLDIGFVLDWGGTPLRGRGIFLPNVRIARRCRGAGLPIWVGRLLSASCRTRATCDRRFASTGGRGDAKRARIGKGGARV
jgi:hypothetical protein